MICSTCHKPARDNAAAYYRVKSTKPWRDEYICWTCLTPAEKAERDLGFSDRMRFEMIRSLRTK